MIVDLDSHLMEPREWLVPFAPRRLATELMLHGAPPQADVERAVRDRDPGSTRDGSAFGGQDLWLAPGAFDRAERAAVCAAAGIDRQLVLSDGAHVVLGQRPDLSQEVALAQHRAVLAWAEADPRFVPADLVPLDDPTQAWIVAGMAAAAGFRAVHLATSAALPPPPHTPGMDRVWATLAEARVTAVLHFGTSGRGPGPEWHHGQGVTGVADPLDVLLAHHPAETYLGRLLLSGVFLRHPQLRLVVAEHGAAWLPGFLATVDAVRAAFADVPGSLPDEDRDGPSPSEVVRRHVAVVPTLLDDVAALTTALGPGLLAFGTDFPHPEGGTAPVARAVVGLSERAALSFLHDAAARVLPKG